MNLKRIILLIFIAVFSTTVQAQKFKKKKPLLTRKNNKMSSRKNRQMIDFKSYRYGGWYIDPGFTYTIEKGNLLGGLGYNLGFGRYQIMYEGGTGLNYIDYGISAKNLRKSEYRHHDLSVHGNLNNVWQFSDKTFLQNSIGMNVDYTFAQNNGAPYITDYPYKKLDELEHKWHSQIHYKIGVGFQFWKRLFIIPTVEIPLVYLDVFDSKVLNEFSGTFPLGDTRYRSFIFTLRIAWLQKQKAGYSCGKPGKKNKTLKPGNQDSKAQKRYNNR